MAYFSRQNPFTRPTTLIPHQSTTITASHTPNTLNQKSAVFITNKPKINNPFQKSKFDSVFDRKKYQSQNKTLNQSSHYEGTYMPLSRYENRMKLREIDQENWKREKDREERYKLEHYGSEGLRYSSFSTSHTSLYNQNIDSPTPKFVSKTAKQINQQKYVRYRTEQQTPRSEYMLKYQRNQQKPRNKNTESFQTTLSKNNEPKYFQFYRSTQLQYNDNYQQSNTQSFGTENRENNNIKSNNFNGYQQEGRYDRNVYNNQIQPKQSEKKNDGLKSSSSREQFASNMSNKKQKQYSNGERKLERKITGTFSIENTNREFMQSSFKKNQKKRQNQQQVNIRHLSPKSSSIDSSQNLISDQLVAVENGRVRKQMSYDSNFQKQKPNFYESDYINQQEESNRGGPLNAMKFSSSSFQSDMFQTQRARLSRFNKKTKPAPPTKIQYNGRDYYQIKL